MLPSSSTLAHMATLKTRCGGHCGPQTFRSCSRPEPTVRSGFVASFNHPGGNITGVYSLVGALTAKHLGLLHDLVPNAKTIAVLANALNVVAVKDVREAAAPLGLQLIILSANTEGEIEAAFASLNQQ